MDAKLLLKCRRFRVEQVEKPGGDGQLHVREVVRHPGSVVLLPVVDRTHICLIKNYRVAVDQTLVELPAGTLEPNEPPKETAYRELIEETGYRAGRLELMTAFYAAPGILDEWMHLFLATDLTAGPPAREPGERIENYIVTLDQALDMVRRGEIHDAKTIVGLLFYMQFVRA